MTQPDHPFGWNPQVQISNGDAWAAAFLASEPDYTLAGWIETYKKVFSGCRPDLTPGQVTEAAHLAFAREGMWNNPKIAAGLDAVFGPMPTP